MLSEIKKQHLIILAVMLAVLFGAGVRYGQYLNQKNQPLVVIPAGGTNALDETTTPAAAAVTVHVAGAVLSPGVFTLKEGSRVVDAVEMAQVLPEADLNALNLAKKLADGERIIVPRQLPAGSTNRSASSAVGSAMAAGTADYSTDSTAGGGLVNINTAGVAELETLPGIGPAKAEAVLKFREGNGPFTSIEDMDKVPGIGPATLNNLKDKITF